MGKKTARQRTAGQRNAADETRDKVLIQDEQEQDEEIQTLRQSSERTDKLSRKVLDGSIISVSLLTLASVYRHFQSSLYLLALIDIGRIFFLICNLSPDAVPVFSRFRLETIRSFLFVVAMFTLCGLLGEVKGEGEWSTADWTLHVLPVLVCAGGWLQKKGEADTARGLAELEKSRYKMKGA